MTSAANQSRRQRRTKDALKKAFTELILAENESRSITVSEIAGRADLNRATFYAHYTDKNDILNELYEDGIEGLAQALREPYRNVQRVGLNGIVPSTVRLFEYIEQRRDLFTALDLLPESPNLYERLESLFWFVFTEEIVFHRDDPSNEINYELLLSYQIHATLGMIKFWIRNRFKYTARYMYEQLTAITLNRPTSLIVKNGSERVTAPPGLRR
ncbi:TetR/AcrR family transcriptional regulator [Cohnella massiliensis]|uniref:TetR/AcrR family transcriptional regulator n=1 Tax=Cohnella massiliensis TaxID=1816691 RepID=UPI001BC8C532|nr:TetR/AcrR family transcriptional regulator [Cohnella massiliensis]